MSPSARRGPGRPAAATADETRRRIVGAARQVFSQHGYDGATFERIAVLADLTRPAINHYYSSKQLLYTEVATVTNEMVVAAGVERARGEPTLVDRLVAFVAAAIEVDAEYPFTAAFLMAGTLETQRHPALQDVGYAAEQTIRELLTRAVENAVESKELAANTDVASSAEALLLVLCGAAMYVGFVRSPKEMDAILESLRFLLTGALGSSAGR